jgi:hypothetical protein
VRERSELPERPHPLAGCTCSSVGPCRLEHALDAYDICECGDYRHQHHEGTGRCQMPNDLTHNFQPCLGFRLSAPAPEPRP